MCKSFYLCLTEGRAESQSLMISKCLSLPPIHGHAVCYELRTQIKTPNADTHDWLKQVLLMSKSKTEPEGAGDKHDQTGAGWAARADT